MKIREHLDKDNLHHAYLIEGPKDESILDILSFLKTININTVGNPDFCHITTDVFKIDDARHLKSFTEDRSFNSKRIFLVSANNFLLEAQNTLLKMFEEPIENTHFFVIVPDTNALLQTFVSRFYLIKTQKEQQEEHSKASEFIAMSLKDRLDFIKELLTEVEEDEEIIASTTSARVRSLNFLNALEIVLHNKFLSKTQKFSNLEFFEHLFKVREFLRQPGSAAKTMMESVALTVPILKN